ncbi:hypothetical protein HPB52_012074 [Rhipicephalus sanguineus]|uniref:Uncharacterized protein n=2 Tax=Rhipicephalus sanguineus TaxID=34632 RepID=A0A9D4Q9Z7_RHISA|nr:hypothetical protein HPB52_012074 [Rhipicephalus sanguineus]
MRFGLALTFVAILGYARADHSQDCPELDCKKQGPSCVAVKGDDNKCGRCSCNSTESNNSDTKPKAESGNKPSNEDTKNATTAGTIGDGASADKPVAVSKTEDKSQSKPEAAAQGKEGTDGDASADHSACAACPEHCMITMFKGKCTGCVRVDDINAECH